MLRRWLASSDLFAFNVVRRDRWVAQRASDVPAGARVLDVGAGTAPYRTLFAHCDYKTQDLAPLRPDQLRAGGYTQIDYTGDATAIPVSDGSFDCVICTEMIEHHPEPIRVVNELARVLAPGGRLLLTAPLGSGIHQEPYHYYGGFTPYWYRRFLEQAGFKDIGVEANAGSLRFYSQESIRFLQTTRPFGRLPALPSLLWLPFWLLLLPILGGVIPVLCRWLDRFDAEQRFTIGYHVTATRR
jgi:ubiquinone/menaquinone biosynthesis C-methylase UbiE